MRKAILAIIAGLLLCAQSPISSFPPGTFANRSGLYGGTAAGYTGPGDVFNTGQTGFYSCARAYNAAYAAATGNMCDVVITSTGTAACTIKAATTGFADLAGTYCAASTNLATACAAGCSVTKVYNQVNPGTCDQIQATLASMPLLLLSSTPTGTLPAIQASGSVGTMQVSSCAAINPQPIWFYGVIIRTSGTSNVGVIGQSGGANLGWDTSGNAMVQAGTVLNKAAANSSWHSINGLANGNGSGSAINVDGSDSTGAAGTNTIAIDALRISRVTALTGTIAIAEVAVGGASTTSTDRNNICKNQASASSGYNTAFGC